MTELTIEARVSALEAALDPDEAWNTCTCGHHGSAHSLTNRCLVCECSHFSTKRQANGITVETYLTYEVANAALPVIRDAFEVLELTPDDEQWTPLFQVQLALEHVIKQGRRS